MAKRARIAAPGEAEPKIERQVSDSDPDSDSEADLEQSIDSVGEISDAEQASDDGSGSGSGNGLGVDDSELSDDEIGGRDQFSGAVDAIIGSKIKAHDRDNPILIRNKKSAKDIEDARLEAKARQVMRQERENFKDKAHVKDVIPKDPDSAGEALQQEKRFRKTAQRGVVKLLNAIHASQAVAKDESLPGKSGEDATSVSKERFLDMIRSG